MSLDPLLIKRFFRNECSEEERAQVLAYIKYYPETLEDYLDETEWMNFDTTETMLPDRSKKMKRAVLNVVGTPARSKPIVYRRWAAAAILCVLLSVSGYLWMQYHSGLQRAAGVAAAVDPMTIIRNPSAGEKQVRMPDGSLVIMAANSAIRYPKAFRKDRTMWLEGSALFDVSKDELHPFEVNAGALQITVLGTRFDVKAGTKGKDMNIRLFNGRIRIGMPAIAGTGKKEMELLPGREFHYQQGTWTVRSFAGSKHTTPVHTVPVTDSIISHSGQLFFDNQPLTTVLAVLQARYNTPIHYKAKMLRGYYFSGDFTDSDDLTVILNTICTLNGLEVKEDSTGYTLLPGEQ